MDNDNSKSEPDNNEQDTLEKMVVIFNINDAAIAELKEDLGAVDAYKDLDHAKAAKKSDRKSVV